MSDRSLIDQSLLGGDENLQNLSDAREALAYLRFIYLEAFDLLALSLTDALIACPLIAGVVIPLYEAALTPLERETLALEVPEAAAYLRDGRRVTEYSGCLTCLFTGKHFL